MVDEKELIRQAIAVLIERPRTRESALALTSLEQALLWLAAADKGGAVNV